MKPGLGHGQATLTSFVVSNAGTRYEPTSLRQRTLTMSVVNKLIIQCALPISLVDHPCFRSCLADFDPKYLPPCRQTVANTILPQMLQAKQNELASFLSKCDNISLTTDIWTDRRMHSFLGVTAHTFSDGKPCAHLLAFQVFSGSHTGQKIADAVESVVTQNNLSGKVRCIVTDNASNMMKAMSVMFDIGEAVSVGNDVEVDDPSLWEDDCENDLLNAFECEHISCFAHSLQLVVRDGLAAMTMARLLLGKTCKLSNLIHQSSLFRGVYEAAMGRGKIIPSANATRWNSLYCQLKVVVELDQSTVNTVLRQNNHENLVLSTRDLTQLKEIITLLEPFSEATLMTQGDKTVTISCVVPILLSLRKHLLGCLEPSSSLTVAATTLSQSLHSRFAGLFSLLGIPSDVSSHFNTLQYSSNIFLMTPALDPEYAFNWLQDHPGSSEDRDALRFKISGV